jgi:hypothetical protein
MPPRGGRLLLPVRALGSAILEKVSNRGLGLSTFVSAGNRADVSATTCCSTGRRTTPTEVVLLYLESIGNPRKFSRIARRVSLRKPIIAVRSGRTTQGVPMGHAVRKIAAPPHAVDAMFRQAGVIQVDTLEEMFDVAQLLAHQPLPRGRRVGDRRQLRRLGLLAADAAAAVGLVVNRPSRWAPTPPPRTSRTRSTPPSTTPRSTRWSRSTCRRSTSPARTSPTCSPPSASSPTSRSVSSFLGAEGVPELLRVPDVAGSSAGRGRCRRTPPIESAVRALASVVGYAVWLRTPNGPAATLEGVDPAAAKQFVNRLLIAHPDGRDLEPDELRTPARGLRHRPVGSHARLDAQGGPARRQGPGLGRRAEGHHRPPA